MLGGETYYPALVSRVNRPGISGGSNSQVDWSHDEQDNEQIQHRGPCPCGADGLGARERVHLALGSGDVDFREIWLFDAHPFGVGDEGRC